MASITMPTLEQMVASALDDFRKVAALTGYGFLSFAYCSGVSSSQIAPRPFAIAWSIA